MESKIARVSFKVNKEFNIKHVYKNNRVQSLVKKISKDKTREEKV